MATIKRKFALSAEERQQVEATLLDMVADKSFNTAPTYSANSDKYPDNLIPFVDKHMDYISSHPSIKPQDYIVNLRLMTRTTA